MDYILRNGEIIPRKGAVLDLDDRGYQFGDGIYEVIRIYGGTPFLMTPHLDRLSRSAREVGISLSAEDISNLEKQLLEVAEKEGVSDGIFYVQITRGVYPRSQVFPPSDVAPVITAYAKPMSRPEKALSEGVSLHLLPDIRWLRCDIKSLNLLPNVMARQTASELGCMEAIQHRDNVVTEGAFSNVFIVSNGIVQTHPQGNLILSGITRAHVIQLSQEAGYQVIEESYSVDQLLKAEEVFITSTLNEIMPAVRIDESVIGKGTPGPVTRDLQSRFFQ